MALKIEIELGRVGNIAVDDGSSWTVAALVPFFSPLWEEANVVSLVNHDHCDVGFHVARDECSYKMK